jgi:hypothetical protein
VGAHEGVLDHRALTARRNALFPQDLRMVDRATRWLRFFSAPWIRDAPDVRCTLDYAIYGVFAFCPDCGAHNSLQMLQKNFKVIPKLMRLGKTSSLKLN